MKDKAEDGIARLFPPPLPPKEEPIFSEVRIFENTPPNAAVN